MKLPGLFSETMSAKLTVCIASLGNYACTSGFIKKREVFGSSLKFFVRAEGLEPTHLAAPDPKSGTSTNFATPAV